MRFKQLFFSFAGRMTRKNFWLGAAVFATVEYAILFFLTWHFFANFGPDGLSKQQSAIGFFTISFVVCWLLPFAFVAVWAKRLHDLGKSGKYALVALVPGIGLMILLIVCGFLRGTEGPNRFGPDPLAKV